MIQSDTNDFYNQIAIIGMAGRFPGAKDLARYWENLRDGVESITFFSDQELSAAGVDAARLNDPAYVKAFGALEGIELFDARFFGINPREAEITDPQQRLFLECAWEALEDAGYDAERYEGAIGVYAGVGINSYLFNLLSSNDLAIRTTGLYQTLMGNTGDYLTTRVSYKINLKGPSLTVQTSCSTSLVAVHSGWRCEGPGVSE
jgi:acyl transferase domain-containing protein